MSRKNRKLLILFIIASVLIRAAVALWFGDQVANLPGTYDQISYQTLALRVINGHGFSFGENWWPITAANAPTAHWSFLYTLYLVMMYTLFGPHPLAARLLQAVIVGILHPLLAYLLGKRLFNETTGLVAAALTAGYVYFVYYSATLMTEPFYITAILAALYLAILLVDHINGQEMPGSQKKMFWLAIAFGLVLGITVLLRQVFLMFVPFLFLWIIWMLRRGKTQIAVTALLTSTLIIAFMILPFTLYNYARFHSLVLLNTNAGYAYYLSNHPIYGTHFISILPEEMGSYQSLIPAELRLLDEAALDKALLKAGLQFVIDDPGRYVLLSISRVPALFMFWPSNDSGLISNISRVASFGLFLPFMIYGLVTALFKSKKTLRLADPVLLPVLFSAFYTTIHLLSWSLIRYRLPIDAVMLVFAALSLIDLFTRAKRWLKTISLRRQTLKQAAR